jgi:hypothetical protein
MVKVSDQFNRGPSWAAAKPSAGGAGHRGPKKVANPRSKTGRRKTR